VISRSAEESARQPARERKRAGESSRRKLGEKSRVLLNSPQLSKLTLPQTAKWFPMNCFCKELGLLLALKIEMLMKFKSGKAK